MHQSLPKELRTELDLYRYHRLSFLVHPDDVPQPRVFIDHLTIRGIVEIDLPPINTTWRQIEEFVEGASELLGSPAPMDRGNPSIYLQRDEGTTRIKVWHRLVGTMYYPMVTFSQEAEALFIEKLSVLLKDYHDRTSELHTGDEAIIY